MILVDTLHYVAIEEEYECYFQRSQGRRCLLKVTDFQFGQDPQTNATE